MATQNQDIRDELSNDLLMLADILEKNVPGFNGSSLKDAANECTDPTEYGSTSWGYSVDLLQFFGYKSSEELYPKIARAGNIRVEMDLTIAGKCNTIHDGGHDPLHELELNIVVWGEDGEGKIIAAWHLDRHISDEGDEMYSDHPIYHFQFGGRRMWEEVQDYGDLIVPEPPRLAFPPMDAILAVNFVLANYFGDDWRELIGVEGGNSDSDEYRRIVSGAQERLWRPYSQALSAAWEPGPFSEQVWSPNAIWPQLIDDYEEVA
ncbi:hypothetical protein [Salinibacter ruber]|uniref:hypothetical protein n=2 Tax=Salinibacter ruber TaxID=146919 RepID=UPI002073C49F|nr:hypothetical protein [Salinibacter ruber]